MRRFFINKNSINNDSTTIGEHDSKHIKKVLRLKAGDNIQLFDGTGKEYETTIVNTSSKCIEAKIVKSFFSQTESPLKIIMCQALLKDNKMDNIIKQVTALGVSKWMPFIADRSIPKPYKDKIRSRIERWKKISIETLKQSQRSIIPEIDSLYSFNDVLQIGKQADLKIIFWEDESEKIDILFAKDVGKINSLAMVLGPEGGFTSDEVKMALDNGFVSKSLGPRILRSETAAVSACTILQFMFGDMSNN